MNDKDNNETPTTSGVDSSDLLDVEYYARQVQAAYSAIYKFSHPEMNNAIIGLQSAIEDLAKKVPHTCED